MVIQLKKTKVKDVQWFHLFLACLLLTKFKFRVLSFWHLAFSFWTLVSSIKYQVSRF